MKNTGDIQIASRYAKALFDVAKKANAVEAVEKDLRDLAKASRENESLSEFMESPLLTRAQQAKIIQALAESFKANALTGQFLVTLAEARRLSLLVEIARQFVIRAQEERGEMVAELVTASAISKEEEQSFAEHLSRAYGKKIKLHTTQDASLLGGAVVKIGGMQLDASVAGKLQRLEQTLKAA